MATQIIDGFQVNSNVPIDNRIVASGSTARNAIPYKYHGLRVFDISNNVPYVWNGTAWINENSSSITGTGTTNFFPIFSAPGSVQDSFLYQDSGVIKTGDDGGGDGLVQISPYYGSVTAYSFIGDGYNVTNLLGSNINNGSIPVDGSLPAGSKIIKGSTGQVLVSGTSFTFWQNQNQLFVGTSSVALIANTASSISVATYSVSSTNYLAFVSSAGSPSVRVNSGLSYNPGTNILTTGRINYVGGSLPGATASKITLLNLSTTANTNSNNLEFINVRNSTGSDWLTTAYRIQAKVDTQYLGYIQFNGTGNDAGISIGTGYMSSDSNSSTYETIRISSSGDTIFNSRNPFASDTLKVTNTSGVGSAKLSIQATTPILSFRTETGAEKWAIYRKSSDDSLTFYNGSVDKLVLQSGGTLRAAADNSSALGTTSFRYTQVCAVNGTIQTSDLREKKDIVTSNLGLDFINKLKPVSYKWKVGKNIVTAEEDGVDENGEVKYKTVVTPVEGKRTHYGLIAQEVKEVLGDIDFGGFIHDTETDFMGLRYDQFISPIIKAIQEQQSQIEDLKSQINSLRK